MKVAINGVGIAGPTLAYWLERQGHEVLLIEQAPKLRRGGYVIDFWGSGYEVAERMGILPAVLEAGYKVRELRLVDAQGRRVGGFSAQVFRRLTGDRFTSLPRGELAALIYLSVAERVETRFGDSIAAIEDRSDGLRLQLQSGAHRQVDMLIGADGLHSWVRALAFGPQQNFERHLGYRVAAFEIADYGRRDELVYLSHSRPGRQIARFALRGGQTLFLFVFAEEWAGGLEPADAEERKALVARSFAEIGWECPEILRRMRDLPDIYLDRVSQIRMPQWSKGRVLLLGDAAACVSLLAGEGCGLAMTGAYILAHELAAAEGDHERAFAAYEARLRPFLEGKQRSAEKFAAAFAPKTAFGLWVRNQATKLLRIPWVADALIGRDLRDDIALPEFDPGQDAPSPPSPPLPPTAAPV